MNPLHSKSEVTDQSISRYRLTLEQTLLLKATLLDGRAALTAWEEWRSRVDIEILDAASYALLPQLYQNLLTHQVKDPHMGRLKGVYRRSWYATRLQLNSTQAALTALSKAGIEAIVLGDAALHYYDCNRPIVSSYLLVGQDQLGLTFETLTCNGWVAPVPAPEAFSLQLQDQQQNKLYVQTHLFWGTSQEEIDQAVWHHAIVPPSRQEDFRLPGFLPNPTDQLLDICIRTFFKTSILSIQGIADAYLLIQIAGDEIEWHCLVTQAQQYGLILPLRNLLIVLQRLLQPPVPAWVVPALKRLPTTSQELLTYQLLAEDWLLRVRLTLLLNRQPIERQWLRLRYAPFPGRSTLKRLLVSRKSIIQ